MNAAVEIVELWPGALEVRLNRPMTRNALDSSLVEGLKSAVQRVNEDDATVLVILTSGSSPDFCSGGDLRYLSTLGVDEAGIFSDSVFDLCRRIVDSPALWCAALVGRTYGGGAELALACDMRICTSESRLVFSQLRMGLTSGWGGFKRLREQVGHCRAMDLILNATELDGSALAELGLAEVYQRSPRDWAGEAWARWCSHDLAVLREFFSSFKKQSTREAERHSFLKLWNGPAHRASLSRFFSRTRD